MLSKDIKGITEAYVKMYQTEEVIEEEILDEIFEELVAECIEEGFTEEEACSAVEDATNEYLEEAKVTFGHDTAARRASGAPVGARRRYAGRKAGGALKAAAAAAKGAVDTAKKKASAVKAGAQIAGSIAKDEARRAGRAAQHSVTKAADAARRAPGEAKKKAKSGIKGFIKRQAEKVVSRMSEELQALQATGKFSEAEIAAFASVEEGYKEIDSAKHGRMYDRYKKLRTAAMKDAQDSGEASGDNRMKMGKMQGVISKSAENLRKKQTKDQLTGRG